MKFQRCHDVWTELAIFQIVPIINVFLLMFVFFVVAQSMTYPTTIAIAFPKNLTSDVIQNDRVIVTINSENVIYFNNQITSMKAIQNQLRQLQKDKVNVLIKADRRSSLGRVVEIWDMCRLLGIEHVNIATNRE